MRKNEKTVPISPDCVSEDGTPTPSLFYTVQELQQAFGIGRNLAYRLAHKRGFPKIVINGHFYFPKDKIDKWIHENTGKSLSI